MTVAQGPTTADWIEAWATVAGVIAAVGAGIFAALAWWATRNSLDTARDALRIEDDRRAEERAERFARSRAVVSRLAVDYSTTDSGDGGRRLLIVNESDSPFEDVKYEVPRETEDPIRLRLRSLAPGQRHLCDWNAWSFPGQNWSVRYSDGEGRRWIKEERNETYLAEVDETPPEDLPSYRTLRAAEQ